MQFKLHNTDKKSKARNGEILLNSQTIETPVFMPVGTAATVKGIHQWELKNELCAGIILGNTYHLFNRPGTEVIHQAGGLHKFMGWENLMLTDSGGYQVYSLGQNRKLSEEGVEFQSHIDGSKHFFSPESTVDIQRILGADIIMALDECPPYPATREYAENSMHLTHRWLDRAIKQFDETRPLYERNQVLFPICQGGTYPDLRRQSAEYISNTDREGCAIGGLSVGEPTDLLYEMTELSCSILPEEKPRYLMGVGTPANLLECIARGVDMFDCVMPTRHARNGSIFTMNGTINIRNKKWKHDYRPLHDPPLTILDQYYSRAYIRHLQLSNEMLGSQIASLNNLLVYFRLIDEARQKIKENQFYDWYPKAAEKMETRL